MRKVMIGVVLAALVGLPAVAVGAPEGAGKASLFGPDDPGFTCDGGANEEGETLGFVVLNTDDEGRVIAEVSLEGAAPNAKYEIWLNQDPGDCPTEPTGVLTTNRRGNGNAHVVEDREGGVTAFWVSATEEPSGQVLRSPAIELD